jgi:hypothetical protein
MAVGEDQNPASSSPGLTGEVVGSDEGLTTISFWVLDGGEMWSKGAGGVLVLDRPLLRSWSGTGATWQAGCGTVLFREMRRRSRGRREAPQSRPEERRARRPCTGRWRRPQDRARRLVDLRFLALRLRNDEDEVGVSGEASEAGSSTMAMPSGAARLCRPRWREGGSARGTGGIRRPRGWRVLKDRLGDQRGGE